MENYLITKRGKEKFQHEGFIYIFHTLSKKDGEVKFWRCEYFNSKGIKCRGRLHTDLAGNVLKQVGGHMCPSGAVNLDLNAIYLANFDTKSSIIKPNKRRNVKTETPKPPMLSSLSTDEEEELFGKRVALFLRRLPPKKKRIVSIEIEHLMLAHEPDDPPE